MDAQVRNTLAAVVREYGPGVADDPARLRGLLGDRLRGQGRKEVGVLVHAAQNGVPAALRAEPGTPVPLLCRRLADGLVWTTATGDQEAVWGVESWAIALGFLSPDQVTRTRSAPEPLPAAAPRSVERATPEDRFRECVRDVIAAGLGGHADGQTRVKAAMTDLGLPKSVAIRIVDEVLNGNLGPVPAAAPAPPRPSIAATGRERSSDSPSGTPPRRRSVVRTTLLVVGGLGGVFVVLPCLGVVALAVLADRAVAPASPRGSTIKSPGADVARGLFGDWEGGSQGVRLTFRDTGTVVLTPTPEAAPLLAKFRVPDYDTTTVILEPSDATVLGDDAHYRLERFGDNELILSPTSRKGRGPFAGLAGRLRRVTDSRSMRPDAVPHVPSTRGSPARTVAVRFATRDVSVAIGGTGTLRIEVAEPLPVEALTVRFDCPPSLTVPELSIEPGQIGATARLTAGPRPGGYRVTLVVAGATNVATATTCTVTVTEPVPPSAPAAAPPVAVVPTPKPAPKSPRAATPPDRITADYMPFSPGTIWEYETVTLSGPGAGSAVRTRVEHIEGWRLQTTIVRTGTTNPKGEVRWGKDLNQKGAAIVLAEGRNGRIELAGEPVLVVGSGPRDTWDYRPPTGGLTTFTVLGFDRDNGQERVRVRSRLDQAEYHVITTRTFVRGVGEIERAVELLRGGVVTPLSRMRRVGE